MMDDNGKLTTKAFRPEELAMQLGHKRPYAELDNSPPSLSERPLSWLENEADIFASGLRKYHRSISVSCGVIAYLIGCGAIFLLATLSKGDRSGYERLYDIDTVTVEASDQHGYRVLKERKAIVPSSMVFEILIIGTAVGVAGVAVAYRRRKRSVIIPVIGLVPMLLAWLALVAFFF
jgi:hypothetical protein